MLSRFIELLENHKMASHPMGFEVDEASDEFKAAMIDYQKRLEADMEYVYRLLPDDDRGDARQLAGGMTFHSEWLDKKMKSKMDVTPILQE